MATAPKKQSTTKFRDEFSDTLSRLEELVEHASDDDLAQIGARLAEYLPTTNVAHQLGNEINARKSKDTELASNWREGGYPYKHRMSRKNYESQKYKLNF